MGIWPICMSVYHMDPLGLELERQLWAVTRVVKPRSSGSAAIPSSLLCEHRVVSGAGKWKHTEGDSQEGTDFSPTAHSGHQSPGRVLPLHGKPRTQLLNLWTVIQKWLWGLWEICWQHRLWTRNHGNVIQNLIHTNLRCCLPWSHMTSLSQSAHLRSLLSHKTSFSSGKRATF